jgi:hypothetical protein
MNKYVLLMTMIFFLVFITTIVASINLTTTSDITTAAVSDEAPGVFNILTSVWNYITIFFAIIFFRVDGLPLAFNLFLFWPLSVGVIYMIVDIIRGNG